MANVHGKGTFVSLAGATLSQYSNNVEYERASDKHDSTTFGNNSHVYDGGLLDGTATVTGIYDNTALTGPRAVIEPLIGTKVPFVYRPEGTGSGKPQRTVSALVETYTETAPVADQVKWAIELQFSGDVATVTQA